MAAISQLTFLPPMADALLYQHDILASARIDQAQPGDKGETLQDPVYDCVLQGLNLVAKQAALPLLDHLFTWRREALVRATRSGGEMMVLRKRLAVEKIFLETSVHLVCEGSSELSDRQAEALEKLTFDWVLNAEKYVDARFSELYRAREKVLNLCAVILGHVAYSRLSMVGQKYLKELELRLPNDSNSARQEITQLAEGMRNITLPTNTTAQLVAATDFLAKIHPLRHTAIQRKSYVHHAMCEMLASILGHLVKEDRPRKQAGMLDSKALGAWYRKISQLHSDFSAWSARHSKHMFVAYPLLTLLTCLEDDNAFRRNIDTHTEQMNKHLRCFHTYLGRVGGSARLSEVNAYLAKHTKPLLQNLRKNNFQQPEQHDAVRQICIKISERAPEFGVGTLLPELLQDTSNWDILLIGLRSLIAILLDAPSLHKASQASSNDESQADVSPELLDMIRNDTPPLAVYGVSHLTTRISALLSRVILSCHQSLGSQIIYRATRIPVDTPPQLRFPGLGVFTAALRCVPYIVPEHWNGARLMDDLPGYTMHADPTVRALAIEVLRRFIRAFPGRRNEVLVGMAAFAAKIPDEFPESIHQALIVVDGLMHEWVAILDEKQQGVMHEAGVSGSGRLDRQRLESIAVALLATADPDVRRQALELLKTTRTLHRSLLASRSSSGTVEDEAAVYVIGIIENLGSDMARQCYWNVGRWSDLWKVWRMAGDERPLIDGIDFQDLMLRVATLDDLVRWTRVLSELTEVAGKLSPTTAKSIYNEVTQRLVVHLWREPVGRGLSMPTELAEQWRNDLIRSYCMLATACPLSPTTASAPTRELIRMLVTSLRMGTEVQQQAAVLALGYSGSEAMELVLEELQPVLEECLTDRSRVSAESGGLYNILSSATPTARGKPKGVNADVRIQVAHIFRLLAGKLKPGTLSSNKAVRVRFLDFMTDSLKFISNLNSEVWPDAMMVRYCLCCVVRPVATELAQLPDTPFKPSLRRSLFDALSLGSEEGSLGRSKHEMLRAISSAKTRHRSDVDQAKQAESDIAEAAEYLEHASHLALACLLLGPAFDPEVRRHQGRAFGWIKRMLTARSTVGSQIAKWGPSKNVVARVALKNLLSSNHDVIDASLDQCYSAHAAVSSAYFQVVVEVYASHDLAIKPHLLLSLVLYKMVDTQSEIRDDALHMLRVLSMRVWREGLVAPRGDMEVKGPFHQSRQPSKATASHEPVAVVVGNLQDTYQQFQYQVSAKLAREHPELSEGLCVEMMTRQLADAGAHNLQHQILTALTPWMENLIFRPRWEGNWSESLLKSMYYVTLQHGSAFPHEIERLWCTVATVKRNVIPILEFLISRGLQEMNAQDMEPLLKFFDVGKRISLFLARTSPQQTIDHLNYEITQLIEADDEPASALAPGSLTGFEFHHVKPAPSRQSSYSSHDGRNFHERQRSHSQAASTGTSGLAGLNLMPQSLLPEFMPDIPQLMINTPGHSRRVSDMLKSASGARADISDSFTSAVGEQQVSDSGELSNLSSRKASMAAPPSPVGRGSMMRAEVAVCLLAEVAYEHDEDFRGHLPLLFHAMLLLMDSTDSLVFRHAQQVVTHLLYSLSVRHLEIHRAAGAMLTEYEKVTSLLTYLQAMRGRRLWHYEDVSLTRINLPSAIALSALTNAILESIFFERDLKERWAAEALKWMLDSSSRHLACRSHQIYRALRPAPSTEACSAMLTCLYKCVASPTQVPLEMAVDIILTLQVIVESMPASKLLLYPQLMLLCFAMLPTSFMHLFALVLDLLQKVLDKLDLNDTTVQHVLLACTPPLPDSAMPQLFGGGKSRMSHVGDLQGVLDGGDRGWPLGVQLFGRDDLICAQQFLVKGLLRSDTELCTIEAMTCLVDQIAKIRQPVSSKCITAQNLVYDLPGAQTFHAGLGAILGEVHAQLALSIISQLPWLYKHFRYSVHAGLAAISILAHAKACRAAGFGGLADCLLSMRRTGSNSPPQILKTVCVEYARAFFPRFAKIALQRLMETVQKGDDMYHGVVLDILKTIFEAPGLNLSSAAHYKSEADKNLLAPIASLLEGQYSQKALQVLKAIIEYQDLNFQQQAAPEELLSWPKAIGSNTAVDSKAAVDALSRLNETWGCKSKRGGTAKIMPFIAGVDFEGPSGKT